MFNGKAFPAPSVTCWCIQRISAEAAAIIDEIVDHLVDRGLLRTSGVNLYLV